MDLTGNCFSVRCWLEGLSDSPCECGIETPDFTRHEWNQFD